MQAIQLGSGKAGFQSSTDSLGNDPAGFSNSFDGLGIATDGFLFIDWVRQRWISKFY